MESVLILVATLIVLGIPLSIVLLFVQVGRLKRRLATLEARSRQVSAGAAPAEPLAREPAPEAPAVETPATNPAPDVVAKPATKAPTSSPWEEAIRDAELRRQTGAPPPPPLPKNSDTDQDQPIVLRPDRFVALGRWLVANWVYAVSAVSLMLAGVFFVQYGIESGLLPPKLRVLAGLAFGVALIGAGEWVRRRYGDWGVPQYLPQVFSGAGVVSAFAAIMAARQMYGLIGPETAFAGHLIVAIVAVVLGWVNGPLLVAAGLLGAAATPMIVSGGSAPEPWLYGYYGLIAAMGLAVDGARRWAWISVLALALGYGGGWLLVLAGTGQVAWIGLLVALPVMATILPVFALVPRHPAPCAAEAFLARRTTRSWPIFPARLVMGALAASSFALFWSVGAAPVEAMLALAALGGLAILYLLWAEKAEGLDDASALPTLALWAGIAAAGLDRWPVVRDFAGKAIALRPPETAAPFTISLILGLSTLVSLAFAYRAFQSRSKGVAFGMAAALAAPVSAALLELNWAPAIVLGAYPWALHVIALAAFMTALAVRFARVDGEDHRRMAYATLSALSLVALALFVLTSATALTLALAVLVLVAAALDHRFRLPEMGIFIQIAVVVLGWRLLADPGLLWAYEAPLVSVLMAFLGTIAALVVALRLVRPLGRALPAAVLESAIVGYTTILADLLLVRCITRTLQDDLLNHWGVTLLALPWLVMMLMQLHRAAASTGKLRQLRLALGYLAGVLAFGGLLIAAVAVNPLVGWFGNVHGPMVLDTLFVAYAVPGLMLIAAWRWGKGIDPRFGRFILTSGAALLALYVTLEIRRFWQGDDLSRNLVVQGELYSYTIALLLLGAALLYQAIARRSSGLRRLAMAVIGLTVAKVFLVDISGLTGLTRVASFLGLGLSLAGLALLNRWAGARGGGEQEPPQG